MTTPPVPPVDQVSPAVEVAGLVLLAAGVLGLLTSAFAAHPLLGAALASILSIAVGVYLTTREV